ncbi:hypothetical protein SAMN05444673_3463 [Bacillus sp. OV166]|nr:hypothetical protein [Bacillus sp. OV166]SMQ78492.1 hypothetical protein SAMN05444673_3463 [Bacillus sp. OV166]
MAELQSTNVITHIGILVHDIEKVSQAYTEFFGFEKPHIIITDGIIKED